MDSFEKELLKIFQKHNSRATAAEVKQWSNSQALWASQNYKTSADWISKTIDFLNSSLESIDCEKFIINAHGTLVDLPEFIGKKIGIFRLLGFGSISEYRDYVVREMQNRGMKIHILKLIELHAIISQFADAFTTEDIFAVTYFRNTYCHPALSAYTVKLSSKKKGVNFNPATYEAFRKIQPYDEITLCKTLFAKFSSNKDTLVKIKQLLTVLKD